LCSICHGFDDSLRFLLGTCLKKHLPARTCSTLGSFTCDCSYRLAGTSSDDGTPNGVHRFSYPHTKGDSYQLTAAFIL